MYENENSKLNEQSTTAKKQRDSPTMKLQRIYEAGGKII
jgi:hypothetical protein